jgi:hypothetical protein
LTVKANQWSLVRQIVLQFHGKRHTLSIAIDHEISHGRNIVSPRRVKKAPDHIKEAWRGTSWIVETMANGTRDSRPPAKHIF